MRFFVLGQAAKFLARSAIQKGRVSLLICERVELWPQSSYRRAHGGSSDSIRSDSQNHPSVVLSAGGIFHGRRATNFSGTASDGSLYQFVVPAAPVTWNHQLVLYAHGIVDPALPIALPSDSGFTEFRDALVAQGFAVGYSSYAANGYAIKEGVRDTDELRGLFAKLVGKPRRPS